MRLEASARALHDLRVRRAVCAVMFVRMCMCVCVCMRLEASTRTLHDLRIWRVVCALMSVSMCMCVDFSGYEWMQLGGYARAHCMTCECGVQRM
jgi:hypothetical protein